jgi:hypothetical protein
LAAARAFRCQNHLQQPVGIIQKIFEFVALRAQYLGCQICGNLRAGNRRILRDIANLVDLDSNFSRQSQFQLLSQRCRLRISARKCPHKPCKLWLRKIRCEVNAGDS